MVIQVECLQKRSWIDFNLWASAISSTCLYWVTKDRICQWLAIQCCWFQPKPIRLQPPNTIRLNCNKHTFLSYTNLSMSLRSSNSKEQPAFFFRECVVGRVYKGLTNWISLLFFGKKALFCPIGLENILQLLSIYLNLHNNFSLQLNYVSVTKTAAV